MDGDSSWTLGPKTGSWILMDRPPSLLSPPPFVVQKVVNSSLSYAVEFGLKWLLYLKWG